MNSTPEAPQAMSRLDTLRIAGGIGITVVGGLAELAGVIPHNTVGRIILLGVVVAAFQAVEVLNRNARPALLPQEASDPHSLR